jgi:hypothetical protein
VKRIGLVLGAVGVGIVSWFGVLYSAAASGDPDVDRAEIRGNAIAALLVVFGLKLTPEIARAYVRGVLVNEGASRPKPDGTYPLGDVGNKLGPAVGPG